MAYRGAGATATGLTLDAPTGVTDGDIVVILGVATDDVNWSHASFTAGGRIATGGSYNLQWMWKVAASEPATYTLTENFGGYGMIACSVALSGRNTSAPITASTSAVLGAAGASPLDVTNSGVTAAAGDDLLMIAAVVQGAGSDRWAFASPAGFVGEAADASISGISISAHYDEAVSAGATGSITSVATITVGSTNAPPASWVIALAAVGGGGSTVGKLLGKLVGGKLVRAA